MPKEVKPFEVGYASFPGESEEGVVEDGDNTAFIPMAVKKDDETQWLCCFPEADSDDPADLIEVESEKGRKENVTFGFETLGGEDAPKWTKGPRAGSIMFGYASTPRDFLPQYRLVKACPRELLADTELEQVEASPERSSEGSASSQGSQGKTELKRRIADLERLLQEKEQLAQEKAVEAQEREQEAQDREC